MKACFNIQFSFICMERKIAASGNMLPFGRRDDSYFYFLSSFFFSNLNSRNISLWSEEKISFVVSLHVIGLTSPPPNCLH